jgi:hypothetical protein
MMLKSTQGTKDAAVCPIVHLTGANALPDLIVFQMSAICLLQEDN